MAEVERIMEAPVDQVWAVLADGWNYSNWVVGAAHVRQVDDSWPAPGAGVHHSSGAWPLLVSDVTWVRQAVPSQLLVLQPRLQSLGRGTVTVRLRPVGASQTLVTLAETFDHGPMRWALVKANDLLLHRRNIEALRRLSHLAANQGTRPAGVEQAA